MNDLDTAAFVQWCEPNLTPATVALAAPDGPVRACPEWRRCDFCGWPLEPGNGKPVFCGVCYGTGIVVAATGEPL